MPGVGYAPIWAPPVSEYPGNPEYDIDFVPNLYVIQILVTAAGVCVVFLSTYPESFFRKRDFGSIYRMPATDFMVMIEERDQDRRRRK